MLKLSLFPQARVLYFNFDMGCAFMVQLGVVKNTRNNFYLQPKTIVGTTCVSSAHCSLVCGRENMCSLIVVIAMKLFLLQLTLISTMKCWELRYDASCLYCFKRMLTYIRVHFLYECIWSTYSCIVGLVIKTIKSNLDFHC